MLPENAAALVGAGVLSIRNLPVCRDSSASPGRPKTGPRPSCALTAGEKPHLAGIRSQSVRSGHQRGLQVWHPDGMGDNGSSSEATRIGLEILGWLLVAAGRRRVDPAPGPGLLLLALGLWVLAKSHEWADRLLDPVKRAAYRGAAGRREVVAADALTQATLALGLIAVGVIWGIRPAAEAGGHWPRKWWLFGG